MDLYTLIKYDTLYNIFWLLYILVNKTIYFKTFIHLWPLYPVKSHRGTGACQLTSLEGRVHSGQITSSSKGWHWENNNQTCLLGNLESLCNRITLTCMSLDCDRNTGRTCKLHIDRSQPRIEPSCCGMTVLSTASPCHLYFNLYFQTTHFNQFSWPPWIPKRFETTLCRPCKAEIVTVAARLEVLAYTI